MADRDDDDDDSPRRSRPRDDDDDDRPRRRRYEAGEGDDRPRRPETGSNGIAVAALVLGISSLFCSVLTGIPAFVCGILGMSRAKQAGGAGQGMAVAGLVLGCLSFLTVFPIMIALLLPAVQKVRQAAARTQSSNNLKVIAIGVHSYHDANNHLPTAYHAAPARAFGPAAPADLERELSWRVTLLPYIDQQPLYNQFKSGQPWDSADNKPLAAVSIKTYADPAGLPADPATRYRGFVGPGAVFVPAVGPLTLRDVVDGTANTFLAVEAEEAVPWPQCKELRFDPHGPLPPLGPPHQSTFQAVFMDGHVQMIRKDVNPDVMRALVTYNGGEVVTLPD